MKPTSPLSVPDRLRAVAFGDGEDLAWKQKDCADAIDWLRQNGNAILGIDLWLIEDGKIRTAIRTKSGPIIYASNCDPLEGETWEEYVQRSAKNALDSIGAFSWPEDSLEPPQPSYFNLCWADLEWFRTNKPNDSHFADQ
jgi:hypothetical protein